MHRVVLIFCVMAAAFVAPAVAVPLMNSGVDADLGRATILHVAHSVEAATFTDPTIADVRMLDGHTLVVTGKNLGASTLVVSDGSGNSALRIAVLVGYAEAHSLAANTVQAKDNDNASYVCGTVRCIRAAVVKSALRLSPIAMEN